MMQSLYYFDCSYNSANAKMSLSHYDTPTTSTVSVPDSALVSHCNAWDHYGIVWYTLRTAGY